MTRLLRFTLLAALLAPGSALALDPAKTPPITSKEVTTNALRLGGPITCTGPGCDVSGLSATPNASAPAGSLARLLLNALPSGRKAVETGDAGDLTARAPSAAASRTLSDLIAYAAGQTPTIASLRTLATGPMLDGAVVSVSGYAAAGDGGGGPFVWSAASTAADDSCATIKPTALSGAGRWVRDLVKTGLVNAVACGVTADGTTDNSAALQRTIDLCKGRGPEGKALCSVRLPGGIIAHSGIVVDRGLEITGSSRGTTLLAKTGLTGPGITLSCAWDSLNYYMAGAPPCRIRLANLIIRHVTRIDPPGQGVAHAISLQRAAVNPIATAVALDDLEIYQAPGDGISANLFLGFGQLKNIYVNQCQFDNISLSSVYDWRVYNIDSRYAGRDNFVISGVGGLKAYGLNVYSANRYGLTIYGAVGSLGVNYFYGTEIDSNRQAGLSYDERDPTAANVFLGGNFAQNSQAEAGVHPDLIVQPLANSELRFGGGWRFNTPNGNYSVQFMGSGNTIQAGDTVVQAGTPTVANKFSNDPTRVLGKGGAVPMVGGFLATGLNPAMGSFGTGPYGTTGAQAYAPGIARINTGSGWGLGVENTLGSALAVGYDGGNNVPKVQARTGGTTGGALGTTAGPIGINPEGGNVGIGTTAPGAKLDVAGTLRGQFLVLGAAPTAANIPAGYWTVVRRTDGVGGLSICGNNGGAIQCAAMMP